MSERFKRGSWLFTVQWVDLCERVVVWRPTVGLFDELTVNFILQLWVVQAHLQSILGQRGVVINRWRLNQHIDEELTGLQNVKETNFNGTELPTGGDKHKPRNLNTKVRDTY